MIRRQRLRQTTKVSGLPRVADVEIVRHESAAVDDRRPAADKNELHMGVDQHLYRGIDVHWRRRRPAPRTLSAIRQASSICSTRSAGVSRNWPISSVKSMPNFWAASMRLPGAGGGSLASARASFSGVRARNSLML